MHADAVSIGYLKRRVGHRSAARAVSVEGRRHAMKLFLGASLALLLGCGGGGGAPSGSGNGGGDSSGTSTADGGSSGSVSSASGGNVGSGGGSTTWNAGNPDGSCTAGVPAEGQPADTGSPATVVGNGNASSCDFATLQAAVAAGGVIPPACGRAVPIPVTPP